MDYSSYLSFSIPALFLSLLHYLLSYKFSFLCYPFVSFFFFFSVIKKNIKRKGQLQSKGRREAKQSRSPISPLYFLTLFSYYFFPLCNFLTVICRFFFLLSLLLVYFSSFFYFFSLVFFLFSCL